MGYQGGIARFTGTVGDINCYFDNGMELARMTPRISKKTWKKSPKFHQQRACARVFGASAVIAGRMWKQLPAAMRRLADADAYGRWVGAVRLLTEPDGQLWDADLLARLQFGGMGPRVEGLREAALPDVGSGDPGLRSGADFGYGVAGVDRLMADLDAALGGAAGTMASVYVMAHPFWNDGYTHTEPMSEWRGGDTTYSEKANRIRKPLGYKRKKDEHVVLPKAPGIWGAKHDGSGRLCGPLPIPDGFVRPKRRVRAWVHAVKVVDTVWMEAQNRFVAADADGELSNGFVTDWLVIDGDAAASYDLVGRDWKADWLGSGTYVVFTALEVAEKRGRHWVRLPWCCSFGVDQVAEHVGAAVARQVGYLDGAGEIVVVEGWPAVGRELRVWVLEELMPNAVLVGSRGIQCESECEGEFLADVVVSEAVLEAKACGRVGAGHALPVRGRIGAGAGRVMPAQRVRAGP